MQTYSKFIDNLVAIESRRIKHFNVSLLFIKHYHI